MIESDYLLAWSAYAVAALGCLLVWFRMTGWMWRYLREPLRVLVAVLLFSPTIIDPVKELFAPSIAIAALDMLFSVGNNALRAVADLALFGVIAFGLYLVFVAVRWPIERWWKGRQEPAAEVDDERSPTLRELMRREDEEHERDRYAPRSSRNLRVEPRL
ncbi:MULTISPECIES: MFS transporter [unclassified Pseudomonas]|uniref:MFS transporter n=1 Tax=unclassified Pseudomonas TaxID=196821 RepID=UPI00244C1CEA|nr:MFS transporter [Pseudomonas sp. GD03944]MDH1263233.1 MFS transporter [Pseudomonas sp. GD03944]HWV10069.1 MFS transporter [Pseudomonas sp.]